MAATKEREHPLLEPSDAALVRRAQEGDLSALGQIYDRHQERLFRYIRCRVSNNDVAEDLTGELFMRMIANLPAYRLTAVPFVVWLYRIAYNLIVDHYRQDGQTSDVPIEMAERGEGAEGNPASLVERQLAVEEVQRALEALDEGQREVLRLRFLAGLSLKEVAEIMDKSVAAVKTSQHRGLKMLRVVLRDE